MFSPDQILINPKSYGLVYDVCVKIRTCVFAVRCLQICIDIKVLLLTAVSAVLSQIISPTIYPKTRYCFGRLRYTLLELIIRIII